MVSTTLFIREDRIISEDWGTETAYLVRESEVVLNPSRVHTRILKCSFLCQILKQEHLNGR